MDLPLIVLSHFVWGGLVALAGLAVYNKAKQTEMEMLYDFTKFFLIWGILFFTSMAAAWTIGLRANNSMILSLGYVIPHLFAFTALGYLWRVQSSIQFPRFKKLSWLFVAYGVAIVAFGLSEMPEVLLEGGSLIFGPNSVFAMLVQAGMTLGLLAIGAMSFYSAYITSGSNRAKMALIGAGAVFIIVAAIGHNAGTETAMLVGEVANMLWVTMFLSVAYWRQVKSKLRR